MSELPTQAMDEAAVPEPPDPLLGRLLAGKYKLEKKLGEGGMGAVYKARQVALEKTIAVKVMHAQLASDPMFAERFHREAKAASRLDHPNSINVIDFGAEPDGLLYIAMEFLDGRDLLHIVEDEAPLPVARIVDVLAQALSALAVAHDMGIIHRDLKPENIMVLRRKGEDERVHDVVKVCDFGIAKVADSAEDDTVPADGAGKKKGSGKLTTAGLVIGTPEYMSPEQGRGEPLDARCDLYSMGVILYLLLSGKTPFDAPTPLGIVLKHQSEQPLPPSQVRPLSDLRLEKVCLKAMSKKPSDRYATAREMRAALRAVVDGPMTEVIVPPTRMALASAHDVGAKTELLVAHATPPVVESAATNGTPADAAPLAAPTGGGTEIARATTGATGALTAPAPAARPKSRTALLVGGGFLVIALVGGGAMYGWSLKGDDAEAPVAKAVKPRETPSPNAQPPSPSPQAPAPAPAPSSSAANHDALKAVVTTPTAVKQKTSPTAESHKLGEAVSVVPPAPSAPAEPPPAPPPPTAPAPEPPHAQQPLPVDPPPPPFNPSAARVTASQASILGGGTSSSAINGLVRGSLGAMSDCYRSTATPSSFEGPANLHIGSDDEGHIVEARLDGPLPSTVKSCIAQTIVGKSVNADTGALSANVVLSFKLK